MASDNPGPSDDSSQRTQQQHIDAFDPAFEASVMTSTSLPSPPDIAAEPPHISLEQGSSHQPSEHGLRMAQMYTPEVMARRGGRAQRPRSTSVSSAEGGLQSDGTRAAYKTIPKQQRRSQPGPAALRTQKPYGCMYCTRRFTTAEELQVHQANHTHPCPVAGCGRVLTGADTLHDHMKRHTDVREFVCQVATCGAAFNTAGDLYQHMRQSHSQVLNR